MKPQPAFSQTSRPSSQQGIATVLIVVLIGVALTATAMTIMHSMRSTQEKQVAVHAATNAQTGTWAAVEAFRLYLETKGVGDLVNGQNYDIALEGYGTMVAKDINVTSNGTGHRISANIVNVQEAARASTAVGAVYEFTPASSCPGCVSLSTALDFHDDLVMSGQITFTLPPGVKRNINVDGDVSMIHIANTSLGTLNSTGAVSLGSSMLVEEINSNDNVILVGGAKADKVTTRGMVVTGNTAVTNSTACQSGAAFVQVPNFICHLNPNTATPDTCTHVCLGADSGAKIVWANGAVVLGGTTRSDNINSLSTITVHPATPVTHGILRTKEDVTIHSQQPTIEEIFTKGSVSIQGDPRVHKIVAEGGLNCNPGTWNKYTSISLNGIVNAACTGPRSVSEQASPTALLVNQSNTVTVMNEVAPFTTPKTVIDVWPLRQYANYIFEYDSTYARTKVKVKNIRNVAGETEEEFWLGGGYYLCKAGPSGNPNDSCTKVTSPTLDMCHGWNPGASCLTYANGTWKLEGLSLPPGILWFKGNLGFHQGNGEINSTILATGNVTFLQGQIRISAVNYGGYNAICNPTGIYSDQIPSNLCNASEYVPINVGNIGIAAGGYDVSGYSGGDINLGQNNIVYGSVLAGGYLTTDGQTVVNGYVTAAVQGDKRSDEIKKNDLRGNTTIDLTRGNEHFNPAIIPDMTDGSLCPDCGGSGGSGGGGGSAGEAKILWTKYL
jgi:hypothetical protein